MDQGGYCIDVRNVKGLMYSNPEVMHALLDIIADLGIDDLTGYIKAVAQAVQIFDSWSGALSDAAYQHFSLKYMQTIVDSLIREYRGRKGPVILFTKGGGLWLESMADTGADALAIDWTCDMGVPKARVGNKVALQGNMDPTVLYGSPAAIRQEVKRILDSYGEGTGHVFNLGHGIQQFVDPEHAKAFIDAVVELSPAYHGAAYKG